MPHLLIVCTANSCRSPMAEFIARVELDRVDSQWSVSSAGTRAMPNSPMDPAAETCLLRRGISPERWLSRRLEAEQLAAADLVLVAEPAHRSVVARLLPRAINYTFMLRHAAELAHAASTVPGLSHAAGPAGVLREQRGRQLARPSEQYALRDPVGGSAREFERCANTLQACFAELAPLLARQRRWTTAQS